MPSTGGEATRIFLLEGVVDADAARRVCDTALAVLKLGTGERVVIDCRKVRDLDDAVLALLAISLDMADERVAIVGLVEHQVPLLRYLGVSHVSTRSTVPVAAPGPSRRVPRVA